MKKAVSLVLILALVVCMATPVIAADENTQLTTAISVIQERYPNAEIHITEMGTLAVFVPNSNVPAPASANASIYAKDGGTYMGFYPPYGYMGQEFPTFITFFPPEMADLFLAARSDKNVFDQIISIIDDASTVDTAVAYIAQLLGITTSAVAVTAFALCRTYNVIRWLDISSMQRAIDATSRGGLCITRTTAAGIAADIYSGWGSNYVTAAPYEDWEPTWHDQEFPF